MKGFFFIVTLTLTLTIVSGYCTFPSMLYGRKHHWRMYGSGGEPFEADKGATFHHREMSFDSYFITVYYPAPQRVAYYLTCVHLYNQSGFLLNLLDVHAESLGYLCTQFTVQSPTVVLLSTSTLTQTQMACDNHLIELIPTPAPLLYFTDDKDFWDEDSLRYASYIKCPIEGGFVAQWQNQTGTERVCKTKWPLRFESECVPGSGLGFTDLSRAQDNACRLPIIGDVRGFNYCLATWRSDNNTFFVTSLKTDNDVLPCFRLANNRDYDEFDLFIFIDGVCYLTEDFSQSHNVIKVTLRRFDIGDVCSDLSPECITQNKTQCQMVGIHDVTCRGACKICPEPVPWSNAFFDQKFKGVWIKDTSEAGQERLVIDDKFFMLKSIGHFENFGLATCSQGPTPRMATNMGSDVREYILIMRSDIGCTPRIASIQISQQSPSVISYRISRSKPLRIDSSYLDLDPLTGSLKLQKDFDHWCIQSDYTLNGPAPLYDMYRTYTTGWYNVISAKPPTAFSECNFINSSLSLIIHTNGDIFCQGTISPQGETEVQLLITKCWGRNDTTLDIEDTEMGTPFSCLASFSDTLNRKFVITQTESEMTSHPLLGDRRTICWVLDDVTGVGSWYAAGDCDDSVSTDGTSDGGGGAGTRRALAVFNVTDVSGSGTSSIPYAGTFMLIPAGVLVLMWYTV